MSAATGGPVSIPEAEIVSVVPLNFGASRDPPLEGFYVANYSADIQNGREYKAVHWIVRDAIASLVANRHA